MTTRRVDEDKESEHGIDPDRDSASLNLFTVVLDVTYAANGKPSVGFRTFEVGSGFKAIWRTSVGEMRPFKITFDGAPFTHHSIPVGGRQVIELFTKDAQMKETFEYVLQANDASVRAELLLTGLAEAPAVDVNP